MAPRSETSPGSPPAGLAAAHQPPLPVRSADPGAPPSLEALRAGELHLWHVSTAPPAGLEAVARLVTPEEAARARAFRVERRRAEDLVTRALVRWVLSAYLPAPPLAWRFRPGAHGRPELTVPSPLRFNLSHGDGLVTCLVGLEREVGVDVESRGHGADAAAHAAAFCSAEEREGLAALGGPGPREARALTLWTLKEAYAKARGLGLSLPVEQLTFRPGDADLGFVAPAAVEPAPAGWRFAAFELRGHQAAAAAGPCPAGGPGLRLVLRDAAALGATARGGPGDGAAPGRPAAPPIPGVDTRSGSQSGGA